MPLLAGDADETVGAALSKSASAASRSLVSFLLDDERTAELLRAYCHDSEMAAREPRTFQRPLDAATRAAARVPLARPLAARG